MKEIVYWHDQNTIPLLVKALERDALVIGATDTIFGFLAHITPVSFEKLNKIKGREKKPYLLLIASKERLSDFVADYKPTVQRLIDTCWPGPLTLIFKAKKELPSYIASEGKVALRVPAHEGLQQLLPFFKGLFSTSANKAGEPTVTQIADLDPDMLAAVDYIVEDGASGSTLASTILDCSGSDIRLVREGTYPIAELECIIGSPITRSI